MLVTEATLVPSEDGLRVESVKKTTYLPMTSNDQATQTC